MKQFVLSLALDADGSVLEADGKPVAHVQPIVDGAFDASDAYPLADEVFEGPEGWDAPGMEAYDDYNAHKPQA